MADFSRRRGSSRRATYIQDAKSTRCPMSGKYYIRNDYIYGPTDSGQFYIRNDYIYGPRNSGRYYIRNGYIYGPNRSGQFYIRDGHIYGPDDDLPFLS